VTSSAMLWIKVLVIRGPRSKRNEVSIRMG
jgi:hypothetical protein